MTGFIRLMLVASMTIASGCTDDAATSPAPVPVASISLDRENVELVEGAQTTLKATPRDRDGNVLSGREVSWVSSAPTAVSVTSSGLVTAIRPTTATITARAEGRSARAIVVVTADVVEYDLVHSGWPDFPFGEWRLYRLRLGETGGPSELLLPADALPDFGFNQAAVSPDGQHVAFTGYQPYGGVSYIFVARMDGSDVRQLTTDGAEGQPAWSPDGEKIAYVFRPRGTQGDIWVVNVDGTGPVNLTGAMNGDNQYSPAWSPATAGESRIAFGEGNASSSRIWTMRPDGSDRHRVTDGDQWWDDFPTWSPDGNRIVFQREGPGTEGYDLWVADHTGANATSLVRLPYGQAYPTWSPDGQQIAFSSAHAVDPEDWFAIYTVSSGGTGLTRRTFDPWMSARPAWARRP